METTRRELVSSAALAPVMFVSGGMAGGAVVSCQNGQIVIDPAVLNAIQQAVATACGFIPAVTSIVALVAVSFPAVAGPATIADTVLQEIAGIFCAAKPTPAAAAAARANLPGTTTVVHGWVIQNGQLVYV